MNWQRTTCAVLLAVAVTTGADAHEPASDGCGAASREVAHELAVMRSAAIPMTADSSATARPRLALVIGSADHFGPGCDVLHKIVEFDLPSGRALTLQISGQDDAIIGLAITASPRAPKQDPS